MALTTGVVQARSPGTASRRRTAAGPRRCRRRGPARSRRRRGRRPVRAAPRRSAARRWVPARRCCGPRTAPRASGPVATETTSCSAAEARPVISPIGVGQERDRPLEPRVEQPLGVQQPAQPLDAGQQLADADRADLADPQRECAAAGVEVAACRDDHLGALGQLAPGHWPPDRAGRSRDSDMSAAGSRSTMNTVLESGADLQLGHLALDPDRAELVDPPRDPDGDRADRPGFSADLGRGGERSLGGRAGDPVGQQRLERRARLGGLLVGQQRLQVGDAQRRQPGPQLSQRQRLVVQLVDDVGRVGPWPASLPLADGCRVIGLTAGVQREATLGEAFAVDSGPRRQLVVERPRRTSPTRAARPWAGTAARASRRP